MKVEARDYTGVTHEFFGMGAVVAKAKEAELAVAQDLKTALAGGGTSGKADAPSAQPSR